MARLLPFLLVAVVAIAGCREPLVAPDGSDPATPPIGPPVPAASDMYVKGPSEVAVGETATYRAELIDDATGYQWGFGGEGGARSLDAVTQREFTLTALSPGYIVVNFRAFEDGEQLGYAEKFVIIR